MNRTKYFLALVATVALASCDYQKNNNINQKDFQEGNTYVYGIHPDSAAKQTKNKYTANPDLEPRVLKIKDKMFGAAVAASQETNAVAPADTTKK